jgi:hypothetical protein
MTGCLACCLVIVFGVIDQDLAELVVILSLCVAFKWAAAYLALSRRWRIVCLCMCGPKGRDCEGEGAQQTFENVSFMPLPSVTEWVSPAPGPLHCNSVNVIDGTRDTAAVYLQPLYPIAPAG